MDHLENDASNNAYIFSCISCRRNVFTEPLPSNDRVYTHTDTGLWEGFIKYAVEMGSGAIIYIPSFIKTGSGILKLMGRIHIQIHRHQGDLISLLLFFQNKGSRLKTATTLWTVYD
jgi:hypothetical protein